MTTVQTKPVFGSARGNGGAVAGILQVSATKCVVSSLRFYNGTGGDVYLQVFDSASTPAGAATPSILIGKVANGQAYESSTPFSCENGCYIAASDTAFTYTANTNNVAIYAEVQ